MFRTQLCGKISEKNLDTEVTLSGWVHRRRDHGGLTFVDLRDREGIIQIVFNPQLSESVHQQAHALRSEYVIQVTGKVARRPKETENLNIPTGKVEVLAEALTILNRAKTPPFLIEDEEDISEALRLQYRYLDLRRPAVQQIFIRRHKLSQAIRQFLNDHQFLELETPSLTKSTPEGARDFLVPSRLNPGNFYALPQSPQLFKQILMVSGFDRYYQIVRCFRDEDLRADRQPEFTQIDLEMSFIEMDDILSLMEEMTLRVFSEVCDRKLPSPFPRMTYAEAVSRFGTDKPDTRFGLELVDLSELASRCDFKVFRSIVSKGGVVNGLNAKNLARLSRKEIENLTNEAIQRGAKGLAWMKVTDDGLEAPITKFFSAAQLNEIKTTLEGEPGDLLLFVADKTQVVHDVLGTLRLSLAKKLNLIDEKVFNPLWVTDFPLFEYDAAAKRYTAIHHPFTSPMDEDLPFLKSEPLKVRAKAYDLVVNGVELGGGSIRIHQEEIQSQVFSLLGIAKEEAAEKFGFLLEALQYGAPPHGGMAFGFDRMVALLSGVESIREVIPFPKTQKGICLMTSAPSDVDARQLKELHIKKERIL
ncbi:Aspartyl-tRNA synthetase @ Aspartyl-tRNA(Asn) synthetase [hydrothermal vent metagenome]|uniref:Aspartyl-tRNA synthetase @ Aspartyl-tRNA(Asn) synthetase n=1 Tax=hydrothermal vent metagenome TaxID=652676 RepID=A0A3B1D1E1_9ZZZZ